MRRDLASALRSRTHDLAPPPPGRRGGSRTPPARLRADDARSRELRADAQGASLPRLPGPRGPRPLGRALVQARPGRRDAQAPGRAAHQHRRPAVRPGLRGADRARLPRRRRASRVTDQGRHLMRLYSELDLVAAECLRHGLWDDLAAPRSSPRRCRCWSSRRGGPTTPRSPRMPGGRVKRRRRRDGPALGRARRARARAPPRLPAPARPRLRLGRLPLGRGRRPRRRAQRRRAGGRRLRALDEAAARPGRPGRRRRRRRDPLRDTARGVVARRYAAAWSPTRRSATTEPTFSLPVRRRDRRIAVHEVPLPADRPRLVEHRGQHRGDVRPRDVTRARRPDRARPARSPGRR